MKKRPLFHKRQLSVSGSVSVAVLGFGCSVQVCWSLIWFLVAVSVAALILFQAREQL